MDCKWDHGLPVHRLLRNGERVTMAPPTIATPDETYVRWPQAGLFVREMLFDNDGPSPHEPSG